MLIIQGNTMRDGMQQKDITEDIITKRKVFDLLSSSTIDSAKIGMCTIQDDFEILLKHIEKFSKNKKVVILTRMIKEDRRPYMVKELRVFQNIASNIENAERTYAIINVVFLLIG